MLYYYSLLLPLIATALTIAAFYKKDASLLSMIAAFFWIVSAFGAMNVRMYFGLDTGIESYTYLKDWELIYVFGGVGFLMVIYAIYHTLFEAKRQVDEF